MENVNLTFWVKAISLAANFGSTRFASTSIDHKQRIKKSNFLTPYPPPPPPSGLNAAPTNDCDKNAVQHILKTVKQSII